MSDPRDPVSAFHWADERFRQLRAALVDAEQFLRQRAEDLNVLTSDASYNLGMKDGLLRGADMIESALKGHR